MTALLLKLEKIALQILENANIGPEYTEVDINGSTALVIVCHNKLSEVAIKLIENGLSNLGQKNNLGNTALMVACANSLTNVAMKLIVTGQSNPGQENNLGNTALMYACQNKLSDVAVELIKTEQAKPDHVNKAGDTALTSHVLMDYLMLL